MIKVIQHGKTYNTLKDLAYDYDIETDITQYFLRCPECGYRFISHSFKEGN